MNLFKKSYLRDKKFILKKINKFSGIISIILVFIYSYQINKKLNKFESINYVSKNNNLPFKVYKNNNEGKILGIGEYEGNKWKEYITFKKRSRLISEDGESAIVINNLNDPNKTFELGFYGYGSTWVTDHELVEFWIGNEEKGASYSSLSIRPLRASFGSRLEIRNHADTKAIVLDNWESIDEFRSVVHEERK